MTHLLKKRTHKVQKICHIITYANQIICTVSAKTRNKRNFYEKDELAFLKCAKEEIMPLLAIHPTKKELVIKCNGLGFTAIMLKFIEALENDFENLYNTETRKITIYIDNEKIN